MNFIDAHSHYMPPEVAQKTTFFKMGWSDVDRHLSLMDEFGISKSLLVYPTSDAHQQMGGWTNLCDVYNQAIARVVKDHRGRYIGAGILPVDSPEAINEELKRVQDLGLKVISLASSYERKYLDDELFFPVFDFAQENKFPIHIHSQIMNPIGEDRVKDPLLTPVLEYLLDVSICLGKMMMSGVFLKYPNVKFIFAHYGGVIPIVKERFDTTYQMLRKREIVKDLTKLPSEYFKNLYFDTSGSRSQATLLSMLEGVPASNILFGSDFPANVMFAESLGAIRNSTLSEKDKKNILFNNLLSEL
jgi:predicted TIM-barrel fold metal-dependent hydrolase